MWEHFRWLWADHGAFYGPVSGWVGDLTLLSIPVILWRRHICHTPGCWRLGKHPDGVYTLCARHHPEVPSVTDPTPVPANPVTPPPASPVPKPPTDWQRIASLARQLAAVGAVAAGVVTAPGVESVLPASLSAVLVAGGGFLIAMEHLVSPPKP